MKARADLQLARLGVDHEELWELAGFHAQQAAEKALKAMCVAVAQPFQRTHDLGRLLFLVEQFAPQFAQEWAAADELTEYAVAARYPGWEIGETIPVPEAIELAADLVQAAQEWLEAQSQSA